ncbi:MULTISPECIES: ribosome maturation factor RimM [unclassified Halorhodospira]|uniref:ribosome maturation factor RimM n=1 Tax=unclassified Halorhodospira TaxID=2626748 RepID=UPI001EE811CB|nr:MULTISPECIES: ribosome maturation factor RimM [unclassified Halorhodospira]MCG5541136.1 ribosome maturation factor RimM [Halorhodospira sp. M39old]MCG5545581.1 ribosome maturation factor RimM [Halorhodospira sp. M38]
MPDREPRRVVVGQIVGLFGVAGWVKVYSYTQPKTNLFTYADWELATADGWWAVRLEAGQEQGKGLIARVAGIDDRDEARQWVGSDIAVARELLPEPDPGEYYWVDLQGLAVRTVDGVELGAVSHLFETGANDVMVVRGERERLIPFTLDHVVQRVDQQEGVIEVDWDPEF